ncbi:hypothetical protein HDV06_002538 [Boothiomyces sp. JEL0866]|nr:hypothetical protein HDV06_002538 [Boothiomyces sp. JEL0866]
MRQLNIHPSMTYRAPDVLESGTIQYVSFKSLTGGPFNPNDSVTIRLSSNSELFVPERSYLKFSLNPSVNSSNPLNPAGASSVIQTVTEFHGGLQLPVFKNYNTANSVKLFTATTERQGTQKFCELFSGDTTGSSLTQSSYTVCMSVPSGVELTNNSYLPLCALNSGIQYIYTLAPAATVVSSGTYTISNVELVACLVTPPSSYLSQLSDGLSKGSALKIPCTMYKTINMTLTSATNQELVIQTGYYDSVNSIAAITHDTASGTFNNFNIVSDFYVNVNGSRYPRNKLVISPQEIIYEQLAATNSVYSTMSQSVQPFQFFSFKASPSFGTGIPTSNGIMSINTDYSSGPSGAVTTYVLSYDAIINVGQNGITLQVSDFK